jgi:hypothetical protein
LNTIDKIIFEASTAVKKLESNSLPAFELRQNYPNPFNPSTTIEFSIHESALTEISIINVQGKVVQTLMHDSLTPGAYRVMWDGRNSAGHIVSSGVYFYKVASGHAVQVKKCVFIE